LSKEIAYFLIGFCIVGGSWLAMTIMKAITRRRKSRRIERGIANYLRQVQREENS
jgi:hypothetical protein